jgi:hypothetical protein
MWCIFLPIIIFPRLLIIILYLSSQWFTGVFDTKLWPIIGFFFMPYTLLWYSAVSNWFNGHWGFWQIALLIITVLIDLSSDGSSTSLRMREPD